MNGKEDAGQIQRIVSSIDIEGLRQAGYAIGDVVTTSVQPTQSLSDLQKQISSLMERASELH
jgi:hypothetical protein